MSFQVNKRLQTHSSSHYWSKRLILEPLPYSVCPCLYLLPVPVVASRRCIPHHVCFEELAGEVSKIFWIESAEEYPVFPCIDPALYLIKVNRSGNCVFQETLALGIHLLVANRSAAEEPDRL